MSRTWIRNWEASRPKIVRNGSRPRSGPGSRPGRRPGFVGGRARGGTRLSNRRGASRVAPRVRVMGARSPSKGAALIQALTLLKAHGYRHPPKRRSRCERIKPLASPRNGAKRRAWPFSGSDACCRIEVPGVFVRGKRD